MTSHAIGLEDLATRFQTASKSLGRSYRELHGRVQSLTAELGREREERIRMERLAAISGTTIERGHESIEPAPTRMSVDRFPTCLLPVFTNLTGILQVVLRISFDWIVTRYNDRAPTILVRCGMRTTSKLIAAHTDFDPSDCLCMARFAANTQRWIYYL